MRALFVRRRPAARGDTTLTVCLPAVPGGRSGVSGRRVVAWSAAAELADYELHDQLPGSIVNAALAALTVSA
jgi:hypothetical protein